MSPHRLGCIAASHLVLWLCATSAQAGSPAAVACPPMGFVTGNLAHNDSFETPNPSVPVGTTTCWTPRSGSIASAADQWTMHSSNAGAKVCSTLVPSNAPGGQGGLMLKFKAGSNEGGVFQAVPGAVGKTFMVSAWVKVSQGQVAMQPNGGNIGPVSWSTQLGEWEQLRVCTDASGVTDAVVIYNQAGGGGQFYVDRVEVRETAPSN